MSIDQSKIGQLVAEQMEEIEDEYGEEATISDVCLVLETQTEDSSNIKMGASVETGPHAILGLLKMGEWALLGRVQGE